MTRTNGGGDRRSGDGTRVDGHGTKASRHVVSCCPMPDSGWRCWRRFGTAYMDSGGRAAARGLRAPSHACDRRGKTRAKNAGDGRATNAGRPRCRHAACCHRSAVATRAVAGALSLAKTAVSANTAAVKADAAVRRHQHRLSTRTPRAAKTAVTPTPLPTLTPPSTHAAESAVALKLPRTETSGRSCQHA